jgi:hypothetical protein
MTSTPLESDSTMRDYEPQSDAATGRMRASAAGMAVALSLGIAEVGAGTSWFVGVRPSAEYSVILFRSVRIETPSRRADSVLFP